MQIYSPILLILSDQPVNAWRSFKIIKNLKPSYLYIFAHTPDQALAMLEEVDWPCTVEKNISNNHNDSPLAWFFSSAEEGIVIQDLCVPDPSFIYFAQAMLERYRAKKEVILINGYNVAGSFKSNQSYFFSRIGVSGAWASWKRAWNSHQDKLNTILTDNFQDWTKYNLMSIVPKTNLIETSSHTPVTPLTFPLNHHIIFEIESAYDTLLLEKLSDNKPTLS